MRNLPARARMTKDRRQASVAHFASADLPAEPDIGRRPQSSSETVVATKLDPTSMAQPIIVTRRVSKERTVSARRVRNWLCVPDILRESILPGLGSDGPGPFTRSLHANAPLAASGTGGVDFAGGLWDPKGRADPVGRTGCSGARGPASVLLCPRPRFSRQPIAGSSLMRQNLTRCPSAFEGGPHLPGGRRHCRR
jgi:hypothetical protein